MLASLPASMVPRRSAATQRPSIQALKRLKGRAWPFAEASSGFQMQCKLVSPSSARTFRRATARSSRPHTASAIPQGRGYAIHAVAAALMKLQTAEPIIESAGCTGVGLAGHGAPRFRA